MAGAASALATHLVVLLAEEEDDKGGRWWAGPPAGLPAGYSIGPQVGGGKSFCPVLYFLFVFYFL